MAFIADGRSGYIPPDKLVRVDKPLLKFTFSKRKFTYDKDYELYQSAERTGAELNSLVKRILKQIDKFTLTNEDI